MQPDTRRVFAHVRSSSKLAHQPLYRSIFPINKAQPLSALPGVLGSLLTEEEAGTVKLTRVAMTVGKVC